MHGLYVCSKCIKYNEGLSEIGIDRIAEELLFAVKVNKETTRILKRLELLSQEQLAGVLNDDLPKKAFWINCYNAFYQILRKELRLSKKTIYRTKEIKIANASFSLDDIEHGILRRYKLKHSFGFLTNPFASALIKKLAVDVVDYRIHFALNCGAKSCPPIAFYKRENIEKQLDLATQSFLASETNYDEENKIVHTTALFQWFRFDFGGEEGVRQIYMNQLGKDISEYAIKYNDYSWDEHLDNYSEKL